MNLFRADLHCHTTCSDGSLTPEEIVRLAKKSGLQGLAITDHDSVKAYESAIPTALSEGVELITGIEFSTMHEEVTVHILGYSFLPTDSGILNLCQRHQQRRVDRNRGILELLKKHNMPINEEEVLAASPFKHGTIGRPHIALAMVKKGFVESVQEAFYSYIGEDKSCYVRGDSFSVEEAIHTIHQANGFAIIAHPHLIKESHVIQSLLKMNFDGLEGYYARLSQAQNERWIKIANKKNWMITGGSDFHGDIKPGNPLGGSWVREETFQVLRNRLKENEARFQSQI
jgi:predicted metal-dependent phosphoesterase TrpH